MIVIVYENRGTVVSMRERIYQILYIMVKQSFQRTRNFNIKIPGITGDGEPTLMRVSKKPKDKNIISIDGFL